MISKQKVLGLIPARGGSKGVAKKNIRLLAGKPLIAWTIEAAHHSKYLDRVVVSTDDQSIADLAVQFGCEVPYLRPTSLATDDATSIDVVHHALLELQGYDILIYLQPTSPLRKSIDIDSALEFFIEADLTSCISVTEVSKSPYWSYTLADNSGLVPLFDLDLSTAQRQDLPKCYMPNGAIYIYKTEWLLESKRFVDGDTRAYVMPKERSIDIDTLLDFRLAEILIQET